MLATYGTTVRLGNDMIELVPNKTHHDAEYKKMIFPSSEHLPFFCHIRCYISSIDVLSTCLSLTYPPIFMAYLALSSVKLVLNISPQNCPEIALLYHV
jgi:hypothetical protein